jgi:inner membrane protein involved in colicin E2 resistance
MIQCINRFLLPILLFYIGFLLLGTLVGLAIGLLIAAVWQAILIGFFIGLALAIIANGIALIIANKTCFKNDPHFCD